VFEGFGVGLTVTEVGRAAPEGMLPAGVVARPSRLSDLLPASSRSDAEIALELGRIVALEAALTAYQVELIAGLATPPARHALDRQLGQLGQPGAASPDWVAGAEHPPAPGVSEFFADELAVILNCSRTAATVLADTAGLLIDRLPATWAALAGWATTRSPRR